MFRFFPIFNELRKAIFLVLINSNISAVKFLAEKLRSFYSFVDKNKTPFSIVYSKFNKPTEFRLIPYFVGTLIFACFWAVSCLPPMPSHQLWFTMKNLIIICRKNQFFQLHGSVIRDVCFLRSSWPWRNSILTGGSDGTCKVSSLDGRVLHAFQTGHTVNTVCVTPEPFSRTDEDGFYST